MSTVTNPSAAGEDLFRSSPRERRWVLIGAGLGTAFEWYDFFLYAFLAVFLSAVFFPKGNPTAGLLASLATFGAGFVVRPLGALIFGRLGDLIGPKYTFLATITVMGVTTAGVGALPTFAQIGWTAPVLLVVLRLLQGLSLGGEYSGAVTYVAEHVPAKERGYRTSWVQTTVNFGQVSGLLVILICRSLMGPEDFVAWGWRVPFLLSIILLAVSIHIRMRLEESPVFQEMKATGRRSRAPIREALGSSANLELIFAGFIMSAGQGALSYAGAYYPLYFMQAVLRVDPIASNLISMLAIICGVPVILALGSLSDRIGRKWIILAGCLLAVFTFLPLFKGITYFANPRLYAFQAETRIVVASDDCHFHPFVTPNTKLTPCDNVEDYLSRSGLNYATVPMQPDGPVVVTIGDTKIAGFDRAKLDATLKAAGYPQHADPAEINYGIVFLLVFMLTVIASLVFAPLGAFLVEQFPTRIRLTSVSIAYNIGTGWLGGLAPFIITAMAVSAGNIYFGFWYPIGVAALTFVLGGFLVRDRWRQSLTDVESAEGAARA